MARHVLTLLALGWMCLHGPLSKQAHACRVGSRCEGACQSNPESVDIKARPRMRRAARPPRARWVPVRERSRSLALVYSGMYTGSILGLALSPHMIELLHWPSVFYVFGSLGVVWFLLWGAQARPQALDTPLHVLGRGVKCVAACPVRAAHGGPPALVGRQRQDRHGRGAWLWVGAPGAERESCARRRRARPRRIRGAPRRSAPTSRLPQ